MLHGAFSWSLYGPDNRLQHVGTYDKDAGPNNQPLYLNGARIAQMGDT